MQWQHDRVRVLLSSAFVCDGGGLVLCKEPHAAPVAVLTSVPEGCSSVPYHRVLGTQSP